MLVHFIGGLMHGRSEAIQNPPHIYRVPALMALPIFLHPEADITATVPVEYHEYEITRRTLRYAIAEWLPPKVDVRFEVRLEIDPFDQAASDELQKFIWERRAEEKHGVRCIGAAVSDIKEFDLSLQVRVEGPEDAVALQLAAEKVQHFIDAELPRARQRHPPKPMLIRQVSATT